MSAAPPYVLTPDVLEYRRELFISKLADWQERIDPCRDGHVEHGAEAHLGRRLVHSMRGGFGADWDYDAVVEFVRSASFISGVIEQGDRPGLRHLGVCGADGSVVGFEVRP